MDDPVNFEERAFKYVEDAPTIHGAVMRSLNMGLVAVIRVLESPRIIRVLPYDRYYIPVGSKYYSSYTSDATEPWGPNYQNHPYSLASCIGRLGKEDCEFLGCMTKLDFIFKCGPRL